MFDFEKFVARHGEAAAQALVENLERYEGVRHSINTPLCERWHLLMNASSEPQSLAA